MALPETEHLLREAGRGDAEARDRLLELHRPYLRRMVAVRLDRRLAARVDPSDVVQDAMLAAAAGMDDYFERRPLPFGPWLRGLATARVNDAYRRHVRANRRSVSREQLSASEPFVERLVAATSSPSAGLRRRERAAHVRTALEQLPPRDREILELRYLEGLSTADAAELLGVTDSAAKVRLLRAMQRLRDRLGEEGRP